MGWNNITGDAKILPTAGNLNEIRFEDGKPRKLRILLRDGEQPYSYLEHILENDVVVGGKTERSFRTVRCAKTSKQPNAICPLCDGQQARRRVRNASNCWDYDNNCVQKLNAGDGVWTPIATTRKLGIDILGVDWAVMRTGQGRNDTEYTATNLGQTPFQLPEGVELFDIEEEYRPGTIEEMQVAVEGVGLTWEFICTPPELEFPASVQEALEHVMPNGKYKDQTFKQIWESDMSPKGMINFLATKSDRISKEKACAQVILVNLGGANIEGVPRFTGGNAPATPNPTPAAPKPAATKSAQPANPAPPTPAAPAPADTTNAAERTAKITEINNIFSTGEKYTKGGFEVIIAAMKAAGNGKTNIQDFTDTELDTLLASCKE